MATGVLPVPPTVRLPTTITGLPTGPAAGRPRSYKIRRTVTSPRVIQLSGNNGQYADEPPYHMR